MSEHETAESGTVILQYEDAVTGEEIRVNAEPYEGPLQEVDTEWEVQFQKRADGTNDWDTFATDFSTERPEVNDAE